MMWFLFGSSIGFVAGFLLYRWLVILGIREMEGEGEITVTPRFWSRRGRPKCS